VSAPLPAQHSRPLWLAASLTAIVTPVAYLLALTLFSLVRGDYSSELLFRGAGFMLFAGFVPALIAMFVVGLPLVLLLKSQNLLTVGYVLIGAAVAGILTMIALVVFVARSRLGIEAFALGAGLGVFAGLIFCIAAGIPFRRPRA
jgi:hypothetical protein